jgi:hypothetical protein
MKAQDISQEVYRAEQRLQADLAAIVQKHIDQLSATTGLDLNRITIDLIDATCLNSDGKQFKMGRVTISHSLPPAIWGIE